MPSPYIGGCAQGAAVQPKDTYKNTYDGTYALHVYIICLTRICHMPSSYIGGCAQGAAVQPKDTYKNTYDGTYALHVYSICLTRMYHMPSPYETWALFGKRNHD